MGMLAENVTGLLFAGGDIGFGHIKLDIDTPEGNLQLSLQSTVATGGSRKFKKLFQDNRFDPDKSDLDNQLANMDLEIYDHQNDVTRHYFMGQVAIEEGTDTRLCWDDDKSTDEDSVALLVSTLAVAQTARMSGLDSKVSIYLGTGLPLDRYFDHKDNYEKNFKGQYTVTFKSGPWEDAKCILNIIKCRVFPQAWGIFADMTRDEKGLPMNPYLAKGNVLFVDPGFRTTDFALFRNGDIVDAYANSFEIGVAWAYKQVCDKLSEKGIKIDEKVFDFYLTQKDGKYEMADGRVLDLKPLQENAFKLLGKKLSEELKFRLQEEWDKIHRTVVGGGGGAGAYKYLNLANKELASNPRFGNASGFKKASQGSVKKGLRNNG